MLTSHRHVEVQHPSDGPRLTLMLQFLGLSVGEYVKALECAKAYLLFHPDDEDVLDNVDYYENLLGDSMDTASIEAREVRPMSSEETKFCYVLWGVSKKYNTALKYI